MEKKAVIENNLSPNAVDAVIPIAKRLPVITEYFIHGKAYIAKSVYENLSPYGLTESHVRYILNSRTPVENFWEKMQKSHAILENINLIFRDMDLRKQVWAELPQAKRFQNGGALDINRIKKKLENKVYTVYSGDIGFRYAPLLLPFHAMASLISL